MKKVYRLDLANNNPQANKIMIPGLMPEKMARINKVRVLRVESLEVSNYAGDAPSAICVSIQVNDGSNLLTPIDTGYVGGCIEQVLAWNDPSTSTNVGLYQGDCIDMATGGFVFFDDDIYAFTVWRAGQKNQVDVEIDFDVVEVSDLEYIRARL